MLYVLGLLLAALVAMTSVASCEHKKVVEYEIQIEANKMEAARQLRDAKVKGEQDAISSQNEYQTALASITADRDKYRGKLRDPGRRDGCPAATPATPGVPQDQTAGSELSSEAVQFLRGEAIRADETAAYALECYRYVNRPSIRTQVEMLRVK